MTKQIIDTAGMKTAINIIKENFGIKEGERFYLADNKKSSSDLSIFKTTMNTNPIPELGSLATVELAKYFYYNNILIQEHKPFTNKNDADLFALELKSTIDDIINGKLIPISNIDDINSDHIFEFLDKQRIDSTNKICPDPKKK